MSGVIELAGDGAHNPQGIGTSIMDVDPPALANVLRGDVRLTNDPNPLGNLGKARKYAEIAMNRGSFRR